MNIFETNILNFENNINELEEKISFEKTNLEVIKSKLKNLFNNYTKSTDVDLLDDEIMDSNDYIKLSETKIKILEERLLVKRKALWLYKANAPDNL